MEFILENNLKIIKVLLAEVLKRKNIICRIVAFVDLLPTLFSFFNQQFFGTRFPFLKNQIIFNNNFQMIIINK